MVGEYLNTCESRHDTEKIQHDGVLGLVRGEYVYCYDYWCVVVAWKCGRYVGKWSLQGVWRSVEKGARNVVRAVCME